MNIAEVVHAIDETDSLVSDADSKKLFHRLFYDSNCDNCYKSKL